MSFTSFLTTSIFLSVILLLHKFLKNKANKSFFLVVWALVFIKLILPYAIPAPFSIYNITPRMGLPVVFETQNPPEDFSNNPQEDMENETAVIEGTTLIDALEDTSLKQNSGFNFSLKNILTTLWLAGAFSLFLVLMHLFRQDFLQIKNTLKPLENKNVNEFIEKQNLRRTLNLYTCDEIHSPITFGILHPKIIFPSNMDFNNSTLLSHILIHEITHIRRFDMLLKHLGILGICVHWYNPLAWISYKKMCIDIETSCDEIVLKILGEPEKQNYALSLVAMAEYRQTLSFSAFSAQNPVKERVLNIMNYKKTKFISTFLCAVLMVGSVSVFATGAVPAEKIKTYTAETIAQLPVHVDPYVYSDLNNNAFKETRRISGLSKNTVAVNEKYLSPKTYRHIATFALNTGDIISFSDFDIPKDESRIAIAVNDERFSDNNGLCDIAYSLYDEMNYSFMAYEPGEYEIWIGNIGNSDYKDLTGKIQIIKDKFTKQELDDLELIAVNDLPDYEEDIILGTRLLEELEAEKETMTEDFYNRAKNYYNKLVNPNRIIGAARLYEFHSSYVNLNGFTIPDYTIKKALFEKKLVDKEFYEMYQSEKQYSFYTPYGTITVTQNADSSLLPVSENQMSELYHRWNMISGRFYHYSHLLDDNQFYIREDKTDEARETFMNLIKTEFNLNNLNGIDFDWENVVNISYAENTAE